MAFKKKSAAQCGLVFEHEVNFNDLDSAGADPGAAAGTFSYEICDLPPGAVVTSVKAFVTTVFNSGTSNAVTIGDAVSAARYMASASVAATGDKTTLATGYVVPAGGQTLKLALVNVGAVPTTGRMSVFVNMAIPGKEDENYRLPASV